MKKTILFSFIILAYFTSIAQVIEINPLVTDTIFQDQDLSISYLDLEIKVDVTNITDDKIALKWVREVKGECDGWETAICDNNKCYATFISSNITLPDLNEPMYLEAGESCPECAVHIYPRTNAGCCEIKVHYSLVDDPDNILGTLTVNANVNMDENCENEIPPLNTKNAAELAAIKVFPNPTSDYFTLSAIKDASTILLRNALGQEVMLYNYDIDEQYDISKMEAGLYFIQLLDKDANTLKMLQLAICAN